MKICIVIGTRPEIIKMAPVIRECQKRNQPFFIIHSNQHYSADMDEVFFKELDLPPPNYNLHVGSGAHSNQTGNILIKIEPILEQEKPDVVLVQGDTNTVLAGALAASKLGIKVGHIEAGLRSYDRTMPEETNRILTDHMSHYLFSVSGVQSQILRNEGIHGSKVHEVGNTITDAVIDNSPIAREKSDILKRLALTPNQYMLLTAHRASNVDTVEALEQLIDLAVKSAKQAGKVLVWPMHPRTKLMLDKNNINTPKSLQITSPLGYLDFLNLMQNAAMILTDSGGVQEEACILKIPCITLRENTERPETIEVGANVLVGRDFEKLQSAIQQWQSTQEYNWGNPFGDGITAKRILDIIHANDTNTVAPLNATLPSISVIGQGYMGLPIASIIASKGFKVVGIDVDAVKVEKINQGIIPFDEVGLDLLVRSVLDNNTFSASTSLKSSDIYLVAVPTPQKDKKCDLSFVDHALKSIAKVATDRQLVIIESTIAPGTCTRAKSFFTSQGLKIEVVHCPERAIPGHTLHELVNNDRIIGADNDEAFEKAALLYKSFVNGRIFKTETVTAEAVKLVENTSRDVGIAFANELDQICGELGINTKEVIKLANRHPRVNILNPGPGVGGHCIPIDPWFLVEKTQNGKLVRLSREINDARPIELAEKVIKKLREIGGTKVGLIGVAYKPDVDDTRETPAEPLCEHLMKNDVEVHYFDPHVEDWRCPRSKTMAELSESCDLLVLVTEHTGINLNVLNKPIIR